MIKNVLVTGSNGFIGKNICVRLKENNYTVLPIDIDNVDKLEEYIKQADFIIHTAGVNRPVDNNFSGNVNITKQIVDTCIKLNRKIPIIFTSSIQANLDNEYGKSKREAEDILLASGLTCVIYRLNNVFGKWCKPNYNSVVATFCYNIARGLPIHINDNQICLHHIDDICNAFIDIIKDKDLKQIDIPAYSITVKQLANKIKQFKKGNIINLNKSFNKKLYATYMSYIPNIIESVESHIDNRGSFTELLKFNQIGQMCLNTILPGQTKGGHYHHTKIEKFIIINGICEIKLKNILDNSEQSCIIDSSKGIQIISIVPGYNHSITNIGKEISNMLIWVDEQFNKENPDTYRI